MLALEEVVRYAQPSTLEIEAGLARMFLATSAPQFPLFFQGQLCAPRRTADLLLALSRVVGSRFHVPAAMLALILREADPVITCGRDRMRWEGFSACCSTYARVDLLPEALEGTLLCQGTTNVDFGPEMRAALTQIREGLPCSLTVGQEALELRNGPASVVEKKVALPIRWLKGFAECQASQSTMELRWEIGAAEARRFLTSLPRSTGNEAFYVTSAGRGLRLTQTRSREALAVAGLARLRLVESISRHAQGLRIFGNPSGASCWQVTTTDSSFHLVLSPEVWRGFSGEGQLLEALALDTSPEDFARHLTWDSVLRENDLAARSELSVPQVRGLLARLASSGRVGYDVAMGGYFQRNLPYDYERVEQLHPRLKAARKLSVQQEGDVFWVHSGDVEYRVQGDACNCPWYARHAGERGPCKHVLAAQLLQMGEDE